MATRKSDRQLVIVESPAKAKTIGKYLGGSFRVLASVGHIRDLPERELGVDVEHGFEPKYVTIRGKGKIILELRREAETAASVLLATDPDREGEAIAYHVAEQLGYDRDKPGSAGSKRFRRVLFHEITRDAVRKALEDPAAIDMKKVEAQQARRILDRLVGYQVSPLLWKPIRPGLSAGRVQTVALRLIAEREAEIRAFKPEEYWSITAELLKGTAKFEARLHHIDGKAFRLENEASATRVLDDVRDKPFVITDVKRRERLKNPPAPFTTSTLQQEAAKRLGFTAQRTMRIAQQLYEGVDVGSEGSVGLITYMRTDSTRVSTAAVDATRAMIRSDFGEPYLPESGRAWAGKQQKGAQEAHEAIRPTDVARTPAHLRSILERDQFRLYELIWLRFVAGQMASAVYDTTTVDFDIAAGERKYLFRATGSVVKFDGFTRLYQEAREEGDHKTLDELDPLPVLNKGDRCTLEKLVPGQHFTQPPPRYTEASLVKELERLGIGRPSTYAQIISTLLERDYVSVDQKRFQPTALGETVARVLVRVFPDLFDVGFTSEMEAELDRIEEGELDWRGVLQQFYGPFQRQLQDGKSKSETIVREVVTGDEKRNCPDCGKPLIVRWNRFGRFLGCSGYPECRHTEQLDRDAAAPRPIGEKCPQCGGEMVEREGRFGPFIACSNYPKCKFTRPKTVPGLKCPQCAEGSVGEKRTRRGKPFWGCTRYPECDWSVWDQPVARVCDVCEAPFLVRKSTRKQGDFLKCLKCSSIIAIDAASEPSASASQPATAAQPAQPARPAALPTPKARGSAKPAPKARRAPEKRPKPQPAAERTAKARPNTKATVAGTATQRKGSKPQGREPTRKGLKGK